MSQQVQIAAKDELAAAFDELERAMNAHINMHNTGFDHPKHPAWIARATLRAAFAVAKKAAISPATLGEESKP